MKTTKARTGKLLPRDVMSQFPNLLKILDNPAIIEDDIDYDVSPALATALKSWKLEDAGKVGTLMDIIDNHVDGAGEKVIIWSTHPKTMDLLAEKLKKYKPMVIHGQIKLPRGWGSKKTEYVHNMVEDWKKDPKQKILIASSLMLDACITITQATTQVYYDRNYSLIKFLQSMKRSHRYGQKKQVKTYILFYEKTIEVHQDWILDKKSDINSQLLKKDTLTQEQWLALFEGDEESKII